MNAEKVDRIVYRFTRREIAALLRLMGAEDLPGTTVKAALPSDQTALSLVESGIIMPLGEKTFVDGTISLIMRTACQAKRYLAAKSPAGYAALYCGEHILVLIEEPIIGPMRIEPLRNVESAREPWLKAMEELGEEAEAELIAEGKNVSSEKGAGASERIYSQFCKG